eukprot:scaffold16422_cov78-Skeletonema_dohrnii-CCMP3373.AAC.4
MGALKGLQNNPSDDLKWLRKYPSVKVAKAFIKNHPPDALMGKDGRNVPLHEAIRYRAPDEVILLLLKACPQAAAKKDQHKALPLHFAIDVSSSEKVIKALLNAHPGAASARNPYTRELPLHVAVIMKASEGIILSLLNAYPQAAGEKMEDGRFPMKVFANHDHDLSAEDVKRDLEWLSKNPSVAYAKAFIEKYPDALMGVYTNSYQFIPPLHEAIERRVSDEVILLLLEACPQAAKKFYDGQYTALHVAIHGDTMCSEEVIKALLNAHPGAASERSNFTGDLPLHDAINKKASGGIIQSLLNAYPQAGKVRVDGLLPLGFVLTKRSSDDVVLAVLNADPEAAVKRFSTKFDECILPLHIAYEDNHSEKVQNALRDAYPDAENDNPFKTTYQLHEFLENERINDSIGVYDLIKKYPEAAGKRRRDGRLPLHIAIDRMAPRYIMDRLFDAYRQAGKEKMEDGRLPIEVFAEQKVTSYWDEIDFIIMATDLLKNDMPVSIEDGTPVEHSGSWHACIPYSTEAATSAVRRVLLDSKKYEGGRWGCGFGKHIHALADACDYQGRTALGLASKESRELIYQYLLFCGRYKLHIGPPEHRTATSVVLRAQDLGEQADYGVIFDHADKDGNKKLDKGEVSELVVSKIGLDPGLFLKGSDAISKEEFIGICKRQLGDGPREVVIKLMKNKDQWERECNARTKNSLHPKYVVSALANVPSETDIADAVERGDGGLITIVTKYLNDITLGKYAFVMDAADRNLFHMFYQEQPKIDAMREILRQVFEAVKHLHEKKIMHGDIKMLNVVRFRIDNKLRLIDLDASATIVPIGGEDENKTFAGAKFSSAILPPEMIERIVTEEQLEKFKKYWESENDEDLKEKVAPKLYQEPGKLKAHYVVKSFRTEGGKPVDTGLLPYGLVRASESIDLWSLGVLAFTLFTGETLLPSTRDDDCASGAAMHLLHSWGTQPEVLSELFNKITDNAARDLVMQLLKSKPEERETVDYFLEKHPFFNKENHDIISQFNERLKDFGESLKSQAEQLEIMNANILVIKKLSYESQSELLRTRHVLLKGIFEATEVKTPTTFIVLNEKLPEPPNEETKNKILEIVANEDGSGVSMKTKYASLSATAEGVDFNLEGDLKKYRDQVEAGIKWANTIKDIGMNVLNGEIGTAFDTIKKKIIEENLVGDEMYLYLIDELTGEPVRAKGWPIVITTPSDLVPKLLPLMQLGMRGLSFCSGTLGLVRMFGYPAPRVPKAWSEGAQESVELLKQESSVEGFSVVHDEVKRGSEEKKSVRGASLREFVDFLGKEDPGLKDGKTGHFAGLQRIGDPDQGTALWTMLTDPGDIESALKERAKQREEEERKLSAASNGHNQMTAKTEKESEGLGREEISEEDRRLPVGTTASSNERNRSMAKASVVTADEINVSNDSRNLVVDSEEIAELIKAAATAAAKEAVSTSACCVIM